MSHRVCIVVEAGGVPGRNPLLGGLRTELGRRGVDLVAWDPTAGLDLPPTAPEADLYLLKADHPVALAAAGCLHDAGAPCLNAYPSTMAAQDKARVVARLSRAGVPVPATRLVGERADLAAALSGGTRFVKPLQGFHGVGAGRLGPGGADRAGPGPWLVQEAVGAGNSVLKVYGVGDQVAVRRMDFRPGVVDAVRHPVAAADPALAELACAAARAVGLVCFGADFVVGRDGPVLVDLNPFPGYRSVAEAPVWLADAVEAELAAP
jgi:ribosomal protein S6--L-glutamate ligase